MNKRDELSCATKRAHKTAARLGEPITWQQAKHLGGRWCVKMWPDFFEARPKRKQVAA